MSKDSNLGIALKCMRRKSLLCSAPARQGLGAAHPKKSIGTTCHYKCLGFLEEACIWSPASSANRGKQKEPAMPTYWL
eukprot:158232-Pelagomonas_calceolata.AAC.1